MRSYIIYFIILQVLPFHVLLSQEWPTLKSYKKDTGFEMLQDGCWLKNDRTRQSSTWNRANKFNISKPRGNHKYRTIGQIRDFYLWFDVQRKYQGHDIKSAGIAAIAIGQLALLEVDFVRILLVRNNEVIDFANKGAMLVFEFAFPLMCDVHNSKQLIQGEDALAWDLINGEAEQCLILEPLYKELSLKALHKLNRMAKGKGIYHLGVPKRLKFEGKLMDCQARFDHAKNKLYPFYMEK